MIRTVLGEIRPDDLGVTLAHEHICCYSEYLYMMASSAYLDKSALIEHATAHLRLLKEKYALSTFIDCTPVNIGRDTEMLKRISDGSEVNILCSTGFYFTEEPLLYKAPINKITELMIEDIKRTGAAIIKCAIEQETMSPLDEKLMHAYARTHLETGLPIVMHTNAKRKNAPHPLEILFQEGVKPSAITVGHLSDSSDLEYIKSVVKEGCYIGLDRIYNNPSEEYISEKVKCIEELCSCDLGDKILLSHDELFFNGFDETPRIKNPTRFDFSFKHILPRLPKALADKIMIHNCKSMLLCK